MWKTRRSNSLDFLYRPPPEMFLCEFAAEDGDRRVLRRARIHDHYLRGHTVLHVRGDSDLRVSMTLVTRLRVLPSVADTFPFDVVEVESASILGCNIDELTIIGSPDALRDPSNFVRPWRVDASRLAS